MRVGRAAVYEAPDTPFVIKEYPVRPARAGEVLVRVTMSTICRSDIHSYEGRRPNPVPGMAGHDLQQGVPLRLIRADVEHGLHGPLTLVDGAGPRHGERHLQCVEPDVTEAPLVDAEERDCPAVAVCRRGVELARAAIPAVAVPELDAVEFPVGHDVAPPARPGSGACLRSAATANSNHSPGIPFSEWRPRSSKRMPDPATRSLTVLDTSTSPGPA